MTQPVLEARQEDDKWCIDVRLHSVRQLFDGRDPAPFREHLLDSDAVEFIFARVQELPRRVPIKLVFWVLKDAPQDLADNAIVNAVPKHFQYEKEKLARLIRAYVRRGPIYLLGGLSVIVLSPTLTEWFRVLLPVGNFQRIMMEGISITSWVAVWRPLETLVYDWWPLWAQRRLINRVLDAEISVRHADGTIRPPPAATAAKK